MLFHRKQSRPSLEVLTVLSPLAFEDTRAVREDLASLGDSPFAASDRTHFARLIVLEGELPTQVRPRGMRWAGGLLDLVTHLGIPPGTDSLSRPYLLFSASYDAGDGGERGYVEHLRQRLGASADLMWGSCAGYPGWTSAADFGAFVAAGSVDADYVFTPAERASVPQVRNALELRERVIALAALTQGLAPPDVRKHVQEAFGAHAPAMNRRAASVATRGDGEEAERWNATIRDDAENYVRQDRLRQPHGRLDLADVQGLPVSYSGHLAAAFVFLGITDVDRARSWLRSVEVTSAAAARDAVSAVATHVAFSHTGLRRLVRPDADLSGFDRSFRAGMAEREAALAPGLGTSTWDPGFSGVDVLVQVSAGTADDLAGALSSLREELDRCDGFAERAVEEGGRLVAPDFVGGYAEHFGFADGISQPEIVGVTRRAGATALPTGELLLGYRDVDGDVSGSLAPSSLARNGSYLVFRKLEQDVAAFREMTGTGAGADDVGAKLVGRRRDGGSLAAAPDAADSGRDLSFSDDPDGAVCPVGSHVRRVNPRDARAPQAFLAAGTADGVDDAERDARIVRRHRMLRRGIPYGPPLEVGSTEPSPPPGGRGLLFVAFVADINRQFEFVQTQWMNDGNSQRLGRDPDVFAGVPADGLKFTVQGSPPCFVPLTQVVTCRGGEYFFLPGRRALGLIAQG